MMVSKGKKEDIEFGLRSECSVIKLLKTKIRDVQKTDTYNEFDFRSDEYKIDLELKTRNIYKGQYDTIFFGQNKLIEGRTRKQNGTSLRTIYLFRFNSRKEVGKKVVYFWEDDGQEMDIVMCGNYRRGENAKPLVNLDINKLQPLKNLII